MFTLWKNALLSFPVSVNPYQTFCYPKPYDSNLYLLGAVLDNFAPASQTFQLVIFV